VEADVEGFVADLVRDGHLIEIQTRGFSALRRKLDHLLDLHPVRLVYPVAVAKWIIKLDEDGHPISRRRSPKKGIAADVCAELVSFPSLLSNPHLTIDVALVHEEEVRCPDPAAWRRRGWRIDERRLLQVVEVIELTSPQSLLELLPPDLPDPFTTADLARGLGRSRHIAQQVAYCLRESEAVEVVGRDKHGIHYRVPAGT
jgi:hypothetical protein